MHHWKCYLLEPKRQRFWIKNYGYGNGIFKGIFLMFFSLQLAASQSVVLISFSMPEPLLFSTLQDCARLKIPAILNGLYHDSMSQTLNKIGYYASRIPHLGIQIDPRQFERHHIEKVPAVVFFNDQCADVLYGNLPLDEMFKIIQERGDCDKTQVRHV